MSKRIAVLGLGAMGLPMASHLAKTFEVTGFDPFEERRTLATEHGVAVADSAPVAASGADFVLIAVRNAAQLEEVLHGPSGVVPVLEPGAAIILTSTVGAEAVEAEAARLAETGIGLVDAPVSGGPVRAGEGDLLVTCGATPEVWEVARPVLDEMAGTLVLVGDAPGKGQSMKTVNQLLCGVHIAAAGEALALAGKLGLDQRMVLDALMAGAAQSFMLGNRGPRAIEAWEGADPEVCSRLDIFVKDMGIVTSAAKRAGIAVPVAAAAEQLYILGNAQGRGAEDDSTLIRIIAPHS
ncbi:NAD(P)-dependent oxidoreductase [Schaalia turicensis]|uniref:NAD(P)-dependent oxidoreductase n=1 Tax=Schaalia turicensis TaxID=131111 RepID=UPI001C5CF796|nr:NAD(P)-dependent oxidoreductase [Schaalia turicensis]QYB15669.1 NAD(P)-dependent oxidoreductase [Schaalia turicensis]